jgi:acyl-CoA dehydrogenase
MHMLNLIATEEQKERFLAPLASGEVRSCLVMSEPRPGAGADPDMLRTTARRVDGGSIIDGRKGFMSGSSGAVFCIVVARTEAYGDGLAGAMFLVGMGSAGMRVGEHIHTVDPYIDGGRPHLYLDSVAVGGDAVLGVPSQGFRYAQVRLGPARLTHCMRWLGLARRSLDVALDRTDIRELFGPPLRSLGLAQNSIAGSVMDIETSGAIITKTAALLATEPKGGSAMSSITRVHCSEAIFRVIDRAIQLCGGDAVSDGLPLAQYLNEIWPFRIYDDLDETRKWVIARRASLARRKAFAADEPFQGQATIHDHGDTY